MTARPAGAPRAPLSQWTHRLVLSLAAALSLGANPTGPDCTAVVGATAWLPDGPTDGVTAILADGRIAALGTDVALGAPKDGTVTWGDRRCALVDGAKKQLTAGLIEPHSTLGMVEIGLEPGTRHHDAGGAQPVRAHVRVIDGYDALSAVVPVARREGITAAVIQPDGGSFSGAAGAVRLRGATQADAVLRDAAGKDVGREVAVRAHLSQGTSFSARLAHLRSVLDEARAWKRDARAWRQGAGTRADAPPEESLRALDAVIARRQPLIVSADRASDLEVLAVFARQQGIRLVVEGAAEGWIVAAQLAEAGVAVVLDPFVYGAGSFDQIHGRADNGALLADAGVDVMFSTRSAHFARKLRQLAGNAVRGGMDAGDALAAVTEVPARVYGLGERGTLTVGAIADVVLWTGDPLEVTTWPERLWIDGDAMSLDSRQSELAERYRELPGSPTEPLPLP